MNLVVLLIIYLLLGSIGVYSGTLVFLFPLLAAPLTIYLMSNRINIRRDIIFHLIVVAGLLVVTNNISEALLYLISVALPAHCITVLYRKNMSIPHMIMYLAITVMGVFYLYVICMKSMGIDYVQGYMTILDQYKTLQMQTIEELASISQTLTQDQVNLFKEMIDGQIFILELMYPAIFLIIGVLLGTIQVGIITFVGKLKKWRLPAFRQITQFTFSRWMSILLIIALLLSQLTLGENDPFIMLGINLFFFISSLLQMLGVIVLVILIKRKKWPFGTKVLVSITMVILISMAPTALMIVGFTDTLFNFRKVKIIV